MNLTSFCKIFDMAYRNGTYIAFHAEGTSNPTESDMRYYELLKAWSVRKDNDFYFINSHEKTGAVRDTSKRSTLETSLKARLSSSKNMLLIIGKTTHLDNDWVPLEIADAVDRCKIPIIAAYTDFIKIMEPAQLSYLWPKALTDRINNSSAHVIHVPFKQEPLTHAVSTFDNHSYPNGGGLGIYDEQAYRSWYQQWGLQYS